MIYITILFSLNLLNSIEFKTDVTQFVNKTKQFYSSVNTAEISFEQTSANSDKIRGKMYYSKGNKYNIWYGDKTIICNGVKVWNINSKLSQVIITKAITKENLSYQVIFLHHFLEITIQNMFPKIKGL